MTTHLAPKNRHGFVVYTTRSGKPIPDKQYKALLKHVLVPVHHEVTKRIRAELKENNV